MYVCACVFVCVFVCYLSCSRKRCGLQDVDGFLQQLDDVFTLIGQLLHSLKNQTEMLDESS